MFFHGSRVIVQDSFVNSVNINTRHSVDTIPSHRLKCLPIEMSPSNFKNLLYALQFSIALFRTYVALLLKPSKLSRNCLLADMMRKLSVTDIPDLSVDDDY
jgi:hypothetical protein